MSNDEFFVYAIFCGILLYKVFSAYVNSKFYELTFDNWWSSEQKTLEY